MTKWAARKRAQRALPNLVGQKCEDCGTTKLLQRHHPDYSKPDAFRILCRMCHVKADQADGHRPAKQMRVCRLCGAMFLPTHSKKHNLCSPECRSEMGRINARKRWGSGTKSLKACRA